jgi:O-antigen/teichoic acid export membrane protein
MLLTNLLGISFSLLLSWLLVERFEGIGAAISIIAPAYASALITFFLVLKKIPYNPRFVFFMITFLLCMVFAGVDFTFVSMLDASIVQVLLKAAELLVFCVLFYLFDNEIKQDINNLAAKFLQKKSR